MAFTESIENSGFSLIAERKKEMYTEYDDYYEPSEGELFFDELKEKFHEILREDIKTELEKLRKENTDLKRTVKEFRNKEIRLNEKCRELQYREENLKREVEKEFYQKNMTEVFEGLMEDYEVWYAENVPHEKPKCNLCDENRDLIAVYPNGEKVKKRCECSCKEYWFEPVTSCLEAVQFHKAIHPRYSEGKKFYFKKEYIPNKKFSDAYETYREFHIDNTYDEFNDDVKYYHKHKGYGNRISFRSKEECQKYCDWLNENKKQ